MRFMRKGTTRFYWVEDLADASSPTVAEITAGVRLDPQLAEVSGFNFSNSPISTPDMASTFTSQIPGEDTAADSSLTFYQLRDTTDTIYNSQEKGDTGFVVIFPEGVAGANPAADDPCDVWPATISAKSKAYSAGNEAAQYTVNYAITAPPSEDTELS